MKRVCFTGPDRRAIANAVEAKALLEGITVSQALERLVREGLRSNARIHREETP